MTARRIHFHAGRTLTAAVVIFAVFQAHKALHLPWAAAATVTALAITAITAGWSGLR
jgi:hypothetical protein